MGDYIIEWDFSKPMKIEAGKNITFIFPKPKIEPITLDGYKIIVPTKKKRRLK